MIFDIYVDGMNLALEYQGYQHYYDHYMFGDANQRKERDVERQKACKSLGMECIGIPYWWQHDKV